MGSDRTAEMQQAILRRGDHTQDMRYDFENGPGMKEMYPVCLRTQWMLEDLRAGFLGEFPSGR
jgi:hypothetical protein